MNQYKSDNLVEFSGTGLVVYKAGSVREIVPLYEEITRLIEDKDSLTEDAFRASVPIWFSRHFNPEGYIFRAESIHRETGLSFNAELEGKVFYRGDIEAWCDLVYDIDVKRPFLKYELLSDSMAVFYHDIPEFPCPLGDLEWALCVCGADEVLTSY